MIRRLALIVACAALAGIALVAPADATAVDRPTVAVIGDSYAAGWTATSRSQSDAWWQYTAADLGWRPGNIVANPGGGYVKRGDYGTFAEALSAHPIPAWTDYVLVQGGLNDSQQDPNLIPGAVNNLLSIIKQQAPNAVPIVVGAFDPIPGRGYGVHQGQVQRHIGDWRAIGDTRYMIAAMCTFDVSSDLVHPTAAGHHQIGDWVAWHIAHNLGGNGAPLHLDQTGTFYTT